MPSSDRLEDVQVQHRLIELEEVTLHCVEAGSGPLVLLLHGFPEFWYTWRRILPALVRAGFHVVAPDLRGYNLSSKPRGVSRYALPLVVGDIVQLIRKLGHERASLVGHDWGANVVWAMAMYQPEWVERFAVLNGPHPLRLLLGLLNPLQLLRGDAVHANAFTSSDLDHFTEAVLGVAVGGGVEQHHLAVLGDARAGDAHLAGRQLARPSPRFVPQCRVEFFEQAGHYVHHDCPEPVGRALVGFLR
ncbi:MAG TPA: alpha/beta hydrolase [Polyangiales bacterium]|nr:alpha/beta hydrolase [Polyangiales bacterium]